MVKFLLKGFFIYSYVTLVCYVGSKNALTLAKNHYESTKGGKSEIKIESLWKTTIKRWKEVIKIAKA